MKNNTHKLLQKLIIINILTLLITSFTLNSCYAVTSNTAGATNLINNVQTENTTEDVVQEENELVLNAKNAILIETSMNRIAFEKEADTKIYPASTTKILTALLALENCELTDTVKITAPMINQIPKGYVTAYLRIGEVLTVEQLLNLLLIPSANDAGFALAIHISGSVDEFAKLMNEKATKLGCTNTNFTNPSGIHNVNHYSTVKDMSIIAMECLQNKEIREICNKITYTLTPGVENTKVFSERTFETTNTLLKNTSPSYYEFATGLKTGYTGQAGSCIISTAKNGNMEFLAIIMGAPEATNAINYRDEDCKKLFEYGFENYEEITKIDQPIMEIFNTNTIQNLSTEDTLKIALVVLLILLFIIIASKKGKTKVKKNKRKK